MSVSVWELITNFEVFLSFLTEGTWPTPGTWMHSTNNNRR